MKILRIVAVFVLGGILTASIVSAAGVNVKEILSGYQEVPAVSTSAEARFVLREEGPTTIRYELRYSQLEGEVTQAHIHFGQRAVNGGISVFLCSNLGNGPTGTQACPAAPGSITGTFGPNDVIGPVGQGIAAGEFHELVRAIRAGQTYVNVHSTKFPGGEVRSQIDDHKGKH